MQGSLLSFAGRAVRIRARSRGQHAAARGRVLGSQDCVGRRRRLVALAQGYASSLITFQSLK